MAALPDSELPPPREPGAPYRVCLVCLGNICRSPMAETVLRAALAEAGLDDAVLVDSAGTGDWHVGGPMDSGARAALARRGYDGSAHRARQVRASWLAQRDLVLAMDAHNLADLRRMAGAQGSDRIRLFGEVGGLNDAHGGEIPDPYGGNAAEFGYVLDLLGGAAPVIVARLARLLEPSVSRPATPGTASAGPDGPGTDGPGTDGPGTDGPGTDGPGPDSPGPDSPGRPGPDSPGPDSPGPDRPGPDRPGPDGHAARGRAAPA
jgi:protein-tyrosine phosphatase